MDLNKLYRVKHTLQLQIIMDILIEKGLITREEFREKFHQRVETSGFSEEDAAKIKENI